MEERKLVFVEWEDIVQSDTSWRDIEEAQDYADITDSIVRQTGFLISRDQDYLVLACSYIPGLELIGSVVRIPVPTIKYIKELTINQIKDDSNNTGD